jgi:hypothetical protein
MLCVQPLPPPSALFCSGLFGTSNLPLLTETELQVGTRKSATTSYSFNPKHLYFYLSSCYSGVRNIALMIPGSYSFFMGDSWFSLEYSVVLA